MPATFLHFPTAAATWLPPSPTLVQRLVFSLRELHRPEVADLVLAGTVSLAGRVLLVEPHRLWREQIRAADTRRWYEELLTLAGLRVGLSIESTLLCPPPDRFREGVDHWADPRERKGEQGREVVER